MRMVAIRSQEPPRMTASELRRSCQRSREKSCDCEMVGAASAVVEVISQLPRPFLEWLHISPSPLCGGGMGWGVRCCKDLTPPTLTLPRKAAGNYRPLAFAWPLAF